MIDQYYTTDQKGEGGHEERNWYVKYTVLLIEL